MFRCLPGLIRVRHVPAPAGQGLPPRHLRTGPRGRGWRLHELGRSERKSERPPEHGRLGYDARRRRWFAGRATAGHGYSPSAAQTSGGGTGGARERIRGSRGAEPSGAPGRPGARRRARPQGPQALRAGDRRARGAAGGLPAGGGRGRGGGLQPLHHSCHRRGPRGRRVLHHQRARRAGARACPRGGRDSARRGRGAVGPVPASPRQRSADDRRRHPDRLRGIRATIQLKLSPPSGRRVGFAALALLVLFIIAAASWTATCGFAGCPSVADIQAFRPSQGGRVLDRGGAPLGRLTYIRRVNVPLSRVPRHVRAAFIAVEDRRFFYHHGVDWRSAARALVRNISSAGVSEGFSTITMQVVRNAFVPQLAQQRTLRRKLIEIYLARRLERSLSKQQILALYLNVIYLGNGAYGVEAASRDLFGKSVDRLTVAEGATLAALARGPSFYAPRRHPDRAAARRNLVLAVMAREGYLSDSLAARARREPLRLSPGEWRPREDRSFALDPVRAVVDSVLGDGQLGDLIVYTTLDARAQRAAEAAVRQQADAIQRAPGRDTLQGALVAIDP